MARFSADEQATEGSLIADSETRRVISGAVEFPGGEG